MSLEFKCHDCVHVFDPAHGDICAPCVLDPTYPNYKSNKPDYGGYVEIDDETKLSYADTTREFKCPDCLYWGVSMYESPCSECFTTLNRPKFVPMYKKEEKEMINSCITCAHRELLVSDEPCASCKRGNGNEDKFEPATEKKEDKKMKTCATCAHNDLPSKEEPCASCVRGGGYADNFEPVTEKKEDEKNYTNCLDCVRSGKQHVSELCEGCFGTLLHKNFEPKAKVEDKVNHPNHYTTGEIEVIKYIQDKLGCEEFTGYCIGNVMKYISRWRHKDGKQDLEKAKVYLQWAIESAQRELEGKKNGTGEGD